MSRIWSLTAWQSTGQAAWIAVWSVLVCVTVVLVVLMRTRWRNVSAWRKCAVLSLWVHILFGCIATMLQIVSGAPGLGPAPPMRVRIVASEFPDDEQKLIEDADDVESHDDETIDAFEKKQDNSEISEDAPPLTQSTEPDAQVETSASNTDSEADSEAIDQHEDEASFDATGETENAAAELPPRTNEPSPTDAALQPLVAAIAETVDQSESPLSSVIESPLDAPSDDKNQPINESSEGDAIAQLAPEPAVQPAQTHLDVAQPHNIFRPSPIDDVYANRTPERRRQTIVAGGGNERTERAVRSALAWLAAAQSENGGWDAEKHGAGRNRIIGGRNYGVVGANADAGVTGLALLAFLGAGHTQAGGSHSSTVQDGLLYLRATQLPNGAMYGQAHTFAKMYSHSMATFAAAEAYAMTRDDQLRPTVRRAVNYSLAMQHPSDGGWRYSYGQTGDTSQLGWQLMALASAKRGGIPIGPETWNRIDGFLARVRRGRHGGLAVYRPEEARPSVTMTAEALVCRLMISSLGQRAIEGPSVDEAVSSIISRPPTSADVNLYYWYYATLALHSIRESSDYRADAWRRWNESLIDVLVSTQRRDGSWSESTVWGAFGGRVYTTAMSTLCLQAYYRYAFTPDIARPHNVAGQRRYYPR